MWTNVKPRILFDGWPATLAAAMRGLVARLGRYRRIRRERTQLLALTDRELHDI